MKERLIVNRDPFLRLDHILNILNKHAGSTSQRKNSPSRGCDLDRERVLAWGRSFHVAEGQSATKDAVVGQGLCGVLNMNSVYEKVLADDGNSVFRLGILDAVQKDRDGLVSGEFDSSGPFGAAKCDDDIQRV